MRFIGKKAIILTKMGIVLANTAFGEWIGTVRSMQAVVVVREDVQGGAVERAVHGQCREVEEGSRSRVSAPRGAVPGVIVGFDAFMRWSASQSTGVVGNAVEEHGVRWSTEHFY